MAFDEQRELGRIYDLFLVVAGSKSSAIAASVLAISIRHVQRILKR